MHTIALLFALLLQAPQSPGPRDFTSPSTRCTYWDDGTTCGRVCEGNGTSCSQNNLTWTCTKTKDGKSTTTQGWNQSGGAPCNGDGKF